MKNYSKRIIAILTAFVLFLGPTLVTVDATSVETFSAPKKNEVVILHTNDIHGQMDAEVQELAYVKAFKEHINASAIIDAGDAFQGLPLNNISKGARLAEIMNEIGYDAMAVGNHEFDYSQEVALGTADGWMKSATFPVLSANFFYNEDNTLGKEAGSHVYDPSVVLNKTDNNGDPLTISVIGASTPETYVKADPRFTAGMTIEDPFPSVRDEILDGNHLDSDIIIVTGHLGTDKETNLEWRGDTLAQHLSDMTELKDKRVLVIDGHSHTAYPNGMKFGEKDNENVIYGQTGASLNNLGKITVNLDDFTKSKAELVQIREGYGIGEIAKYLSPDQKIVDMLADADADFEEQTEAVMLANNPVHLEGSRENARTRETNLGNLITDAFLDYAHDQWDTTAHVAVLNGGGIRANIEKDKPITLKSVLTVLPYGNRIVQIDVTGKQLYEMYEHGLKANLAEGKDENGLPLLTTDPAILHSSDSIRVYFDPRRDAGDRVFDIQIMDPKTGVMEDVDLTKTYKVVTLEFLAVGGDGFKMLGGSRLEGINDADVFADYLLEEDADAFIDWDAYNPDLPASRVIPTAYKSKSDTTRLGGADRIETAIKVSMEAYDTSDSVILTGQMGGVDALTGTLLAADKDAPVLITHQEKLTEATHTEIKRLKAKDVYIMGGLDVVSQAVETALKDAGFTVTRISGVNRFETAAHVAKEVDSKTGHAFVALGYTADKEMALADALAIAPVTGKENSPVLLVRNNSIPKETLKAMKDLGIKKVTIIGGTAAVSTNVEKQIKALATVNRVSGDSRYTTALAVAETYFKDADKAIVANGHSTSDALVSGYLGNKVSAPIILATNKGLTKETRKYIETNIDAAFVIGGETVMPASTVNQIDDAISAK